MTRNALALPSIPPNQVLAGLALFLSLVHHVAGAHRGQRPSACSPTCDGTTTSTAPLGAGIAPLQHFMLAHTREEDIALMTRAAGMPRTRRRRKRCRCRP